MEKNDKYKREVAEKQLYGAEKDSRKLKEKEGE